MSGFDVVLVRSPRPAERDQYRPITGMKAMTRNEAHSFLGDLEAERDRFEHLLITQPTCPYAWYWEVRLKIARYLISRYGNPIDGEMPVPVPEPFPHSIGTLHSRFHLKDRRRIRTLLHRIQDEVAQSREMN